MQTHAFQLVVTYDLWPTGSFHHAVRGGPGACSLGNLKLSETLFLAFWDIHVFG